MINNTAPIIAKIKSNKNAHIQLLIAPNFVVSDSDTVMFNGETRYGTFLVYDHLHIYIYCYNK